MRRATLWVRDGKYLRPVRVRAGVTDGTITEVVGDELTDGTEVVTGEIKNEIGAAANTNPFGPPQWGRQKGSGSSGGGSGMRGFRP